MQKLGRIPLSPEPHAPHWWLPANGGGTVEGFNDASIETFAKADTSRLESEGREAIQNALDPVRDPARPVRVEIHVGAVDPRTVPGHMELYTAFGDCLATIRSIAAQNAGQEIDSKSRDFYQAAREELRKAELLVLRISDYNTKGLVGADTGAIGTPWHDLVKARGASHKGADAGGSFGIGKMAAFGCSQLRTVFYGTQVAGQDSYIGVTRLQSFARGGDLTGPLTSGTGFYTDCEAAHATMGPCPLRDVPRTEDGTDVYILGAAGTRAEILGAFRRAVLRHFFISLYEGRLAVTLTDDQGTTLTLTRANLGRSLDALRAEAGTRAERQAADELMAYYDLLRHAGIDDETYATIPLDPARYGAEYDFADGDCTLLLKKGDALNRRILMTRRDGMSIYPMKNFPGGLSFTGILRITGQEMNRFFRAMEVPSHDAWVAETPVQKKGLRGLHAYLQACIEAHCKTAEDAAVPAYGMEEFFLADEPTVTEKGKNASASGVTRRRKPTANRVSITAHRELPKTQYHPDPEGSGQAVREKRETLQMQHGQNNGASTSPGGAPERAWRRKTVSMRVLPVDPLHGAYRLQLQAPTRKRDARIELYASPEHHMSKGTCGLPFATATCPGHTLTIEGNAIRLGPVARGEALTIAFTLALPGLFMMEAEYYEAT